MKNKTFKNLILLGVLAVFAMTVNQAHAQGYVGMYSYSPSYIDTSTVYPNNIYNGVSNNYGQQLPYTYLPAQQQTQQIQYVPQQQVQYVQQQPQIQYVQQQPQVQYVVQQPQVQYVAQPTVKYVTTGNTQGASVVNAYTTTPTTKVVYGNNTGYTGNTGQYISYDGGNSMGATAYAYPNAGQVVTTPVVNGNGVTALSINGSGSFMPSSVFQWIMLILIILAIIIVARMIVKKSSNNDPHAVPTH